MYWLIERGSPAEWWVRGEGNGKGGMAVEEWTRDSSKAMRLTEWGARNHAKELEQWGVKGPLRATEHIDCDGPDLDAAEDVRPDVAGLLKRCDKWLIDFESALDSDADVVIRDCRSIIETLAGERDTSNEEISRLDARIDAAEGDQESMLTDLAALLRALGMGDHARAKSPHAVMLDAIQEVCDLRAQLAEYRADAERLRMLVDAAIVWAFCPAAGGYKDGPSVEDTCEALGAAVDVYLGTDLPTLTDEWWTLKEMRAAIDAARGASTKEVE